MRHLYIGTFLIALAALALEVALTRVLSLVTWYHLAFFALSTAMLGMTVGAVRVYLQPDRFTKDRFGVEAANSTLLFAVAVPFTLFLLCLVPAGATLSMMGLVSLFVTTVTCSLPFYFVGIAITLALTRSGLPVGRIYGVDLIGAALGCLFVLGGLNVRGAPSVIFWCAALGALAAFFYGKGRSAGFRILCLLVAVAWTAAGATNTYGKYGIYPLICKSIMQMPSDVAEETGFSSTLAQRFTIVEIEKWNALSRVSVSPEMLRGPSLWMPSPKMPPQQPIPQREFQIDGGASTTLRRFASKEDLAHQQYDIVNVPYYLRPSGGAAVIGVGGGKDTQSAIWFGHDRVVAIDVNPAITELLLGQFREFVGIADYGDVEIVNDDARAFLTRTDERFNLIQMSLIDSWAATQAGAFTLSENALYTLEAWTIFLQRLKPGGIYTVTRFLDKDNNLGEAGRMLSLGVAALLEIGVEDPSKHLALVTYGRAGTLMLSNEPLTDEDLATLGKECTRLGFQVSIVPGVPCPVPVLKQIIESKSMAELLAITNAQPLNYDPPTDEDPYFFNLLRLESLRAGFNHTGGILGGNTMATFVLVGLIGCLSVLAFLTIIVPLLLRRRLVGAVLEARGPKTSPITILMGGLYFSAIGAGFMFAEIALIQRLSVFLGHPTYALGVLLFTMILSAGIGSLISEKLPMTNRLFFVLCAAILATALWFIDKALHPALAHMIHEGLGTRVAVAVGLIAPLGVLMGFFFPAGMRFARRVDASDTPWFWALNGVFGVLCTACAVFVSLYLGISTNYKIAAVCYASLIVTNLGFVRAKRVVAAEESPTEPVEPKLA